MLVLPNWLTDVICVMPAMRPNMRSSGVATEDAMVSGLAPGRFVFTLIVGYSTSGRGATGICGKATEPASSKAIVSSDVATGRSINGADIFMRLVRDEMVWSAERQLLHIVFPLTKGTPR